MPSAVLGVNEVSTLEMASAYGTLAFGGAARAADARDQHDHVATARCSTRLTRAPQQAVEPAIASEAVDILKGVVASGTGTGANIGRPQFGKTGTAQNASDAWFVGADPPARHRGLGGFPAGADPDVLRERADLDRLRGDVAGLDLACVHVGGDGGHARARSSRTAPAVEYVTLRVDVTQGCLANPYTPPRDIDVLQYVAGAEPTLEVCTQPTSYQ